MTSNRSRVASMDTYAAGAAAAFTVDVLVYPLDTLKTRYQSQDYLATYGSSRQQALALKGLYQGIGSVVLATLPAAGLFFWAYEESKSVIGRASPLHQPLVHASASAVAEMASCLVLAPAEVVKQNAQMMHGARHVRDKAAGASTSLRAFRQLAAKDAPRKLLTGYTALVARNLPFTALQFPIFEHVRRRAWAWERRKLHGRKDRPAGVLETGLVAGGSAAVAGAVAALITTPSDVVKTRMMLMAGSGGVGAPGRNASGHDADLGAWSVSRRVYQERGIRGFFRGGLFRSGWTALGSSLYLGTYDAAKLWLRRRKKSLERDDARVL
ncbi:hypothetical protein UVI_02054460 [Ustilaginoidea virens]|nr:hypothetical protein UVI_02054460 [Ustilaginoidea virens]